jgi:hypothetical protein
MLFLKTLSYQMRRKDYQFSLIFNDENGPFRKRIAEYTNSCRTLNELFFHKDFTGMMLSDLSYNCRLGYPIIMQLF